jgi:hypothetical protein
MEIGRFSGGDVCSIADPILAPLARPLLLPPSAGGLLVRVPAAVAGRASVAAYISRGLYAGGCGLGVGAGGGTLARAGSVGKGGAGTLCRSGRIGLRGTNPRGSSLSGRTITFAVPVAEAASWTGAGCSCTPASASASSATNCCGSVACPAASGDSSRTLFSG